MKKLLLIIILSALLAFITTGTAWLHHQFVTGLNPVLSIVITPVVLVTAIIVCYLLFKTFKAYTDFTPSALFATGLCCYLILAFLLKSIYGNSVLDIHLHDTYFVIANFYPPFFIAAGFAVFAAIYHWFHKVFSRQLNYRLGYIHFWITFLSVGFLLLPVQYEGLSGMPRRYYDFSDTGYLNTWFEYGSPVLVPVLLLTLAQLIFVFNCCYSLLKKRS